MNKFAQEHAELIRIIFYGAIATIIIISLIALIATAARVTNNETYYDDISETNLELKNTGAITEKMTTFIGLEKIGDNNNIPTELNAKSSTIVRTYMTFAYPKAKRISYKNGTGKKDGDNVYTYEAQLDTGEKFTITVEDLNNSAYKLKISDKNNEVFSYESAEFSEEYKDIRSFATKLLPKVFTNVEGLSFSITWKNNKYNLNINHCNNEKTIEKAIEIARNWIKSTGYNPDDVEFNVPYMCDGGYN